MWRNQTHRQAHPAAKDNPCNKMYSAFCLSNGASMKSVEKPTNKKNTANTNALWFKVLGKAVWGAWAVSLMT